jgi:hypothetical protein
MESLNDTHIKLLYILDNLVQCIEGGWFIGDGALLGITRENALIEHDDDIDLYLLPGSKINYDKLEKQNLKSQNYYMNEKIYSDNFKKSTTNNAWKHYCQRVKTKNLGLNRCDVLKLASQDYKIQKKEAHFSSPNIDIFYLYPHNSLYYIEHWETLYHYKPDEVETLIPYSLYDIPVFLPSHKERILERQYGKNWRLPAKNFNYY